jgi:hypothetical protein|tara:strand:- start:2710 stop:2952 length:243 start_codon:yes stop_codon:yes gene_type:complete
MAEESVDIMAMFKAKMGFSAEDVPMDEKQTENFLLLCQQASLESQGLMDNGEEEGANVKVIKVHDGNIHGMMNKILGGGY